MVDNYQLLKNAVVAQTADDYRRALCEEHREDLDEEQRKELESSIKAFERWFTREASLFTTLDGIDLMNAIKADVIENDYDYKAITKGSDLVY